jgi:hypothetical protein
MESQEFIYEVDPENKIINKLELTYELKCSIANIYKEFLHIKRSYIYMCFEKNEVDDTKKWYFYPPDIPNSFGPCKSRKKTFYGKCYIVGDIYKINDEEKWRVMQLSSMYHKYMDEYIQFE